jgi:hypothetical protein
MHLRKRGICLAGKKLTNPQIERKIILCRKPYPAATLNLHPYIIRKVGDGEKQKTFKEMIGIGSWSIALQTRIKSAISFVSTRNKDE